MTSVLWNQAPSGALLSVEPLSLSLSLSLPLFLHLYFLPSVRRPHHTLQPKAAEDCIYLFDMVGGWNVHKQGKWQAEGEREKQVPC